MIIAVGAVFVATMAQARVIGMEKSTHQVQFVPMETPGGEEVSGKVLDDQLEKAFGEEYHEREYM